MQDKHEDNLDESGRYEVAMMPILLEESIDRESSISLINTVEQRLHKMLCHPQSPGSHDEYRMMVLWFLDLAMTNLLLSLIHLPAWSPSRRHVSS